MPRNVVHRDLDEATARTVVAEIAKDSANVFFTHHAEARMTQRGITRTQVLRCLTHGRITEGPYRDSNGSWKLTMNAASADDVITVVAALDWRESRGNYAIIVTTWR